MHSLSVCLIQAKKMHSYLFFCLIIKMNMFEHSAYYFLVLSGDPLNQ